MRSLLLGMMAVCGIGSPSGRRNSATTANQSASAPTVAASQNARTQAQTPCPPIAWLATKPPSMAASRSKAVIFMRRCAPRVRGQGGMGNGGRAVARRVGHAVMALEGRISFAAYQACARRRPVVPASPESLARWRQAVETLD